MTAETSSTLYICELPPPRRLVDDPKTDFASAVRVWTPESRSPSIKLTGASPLSADSHEIDSFLAFPKERGYWHANAICASDSGMPRAMLDRPDEPLLLYHEKLSPRENFCGAFRLLHISPVCLSKDRFWLVTFAQASEAAPKWFSAQAPIR